jgi:Xaa-Pro dipeptidase
MPPEVRSLQLQNRVDLVEATVVNGYPRHSHEEMERRYDMIQHAFAQRELGAILVTGTGYIDSPFQYFTNWASRAASVLIFWPDGRREMHVRLWNHLPNAREIAVVEDIRYGGDTHADLLRGVADRLSRSLSRSRTVGLIGHFGYWDVDYLRTETRCDVVSLKPEYETMRRVKSEEELKFLRAAAEMGDRAIEALAGTLKPGLREYELKRIAQDAYIGTRAEPAVTYFLSTPMQDPDRCVPRQYLSDRRLQAGDLVVTEISASYWGYSGQVLRTFVIGDRPSDNVVRLHSLAMEVYDALNLLCVPGTTVGELLDAADIIDGAGFTVWDDLVHGYGGGYLSPVLRTNTTGGSDTGRDLALEANWVLVVQPNVVTPDGRTGVQVGNALVVSEGRCEVLQQTPTELIVCG